MGTATRGRYHSNMPNPSWPRRLPVRSRAHAQHPAVPAVRASHLARAVAAVLVLTTAAPAWPQGTAPGTAAAQPGRTSAAATANARLSTAAPGVSASQTSQAPTLAPAPVPGLNGGVSDQVYDNLNRSVRAGQKSEFGLRSGNTVVESAGIQLPDLGDPSTASLSPDMEKRLGDRIMRSIRRDPDYVSDPLLNDYLNALGYRLVQAARRMNIAGSNGAGTFATGFELFGVRDRSINAFAMPGGFIGVHTGLLVQSDTESELASVLGHEIGHVMQRHIARGITSQDQSMWIALASMVLAGLAATKSGDAAAALAMGGQGAAIANQLSFSRGAEREADRVGFQIMTAAGFDPQGMPDFFQRLQRVTGISDNSVPAYVRTHPLTSERIADMQDRVRHVAAHRVGNTPDYEFARVRAAVLQSPTPNDLRNLLASFQAQVSTASPTRLPAVYYGIAFANQQLRRYVEADKALAEARRLYGTIPGATSGTPMLDVMAVELARSEGRAQDALTQAAATLRAFPLSHAAAITYADTLLATNRLDEAVKFLRSRTREETGRSEWWEMLARAYAAQGKRLQQHQALAEKYAMDGSYQAAIEQLQIARKAGDGDFYTLSEVDARLHQLQLQYKEDRQDNKGMPN
ncbi:MULTISPECIES: M48 family metalloprotease [unclassified Cupriavidus]|uniref:beta-barrel assembly-enhancing protease n=2 Tax=unclassified Cupriavidus TaxID=2640874 RepID=UPI001C002CFE|nr:MULTISPECIES: M48 family metalloprotease [unclassified Cupriavidus]MCA3186430.1 M48 family metalloprotease [Cupriavidus sp.]MCA3190227.1 M48 family metalloprotease [Cupriavidus sp.]MCA3196931.1 M48 family metalloprotease [Cupriavidus sp.]MCA3202208.1 M48 family metalloprotease [Cupriavidus sp.]MCA3208220.1 M48 family metalloprotease [Cupriavidus sp.]